MKKIVLSVSTIIFSMALFQSCDVTNVEEGRVVEEHNHHLVSEVFEVETDFNLEQNGSYSTDLIKFNTPSKPGDMLVAYTLYEVADGEDVWRVLPLTISLKDNNTISYNFDFTQKSFRFFIEGNTGFLNSLPVNDFNKFTKRKVFRVVVIPGKIAGTTNATSNHKNISKFSSKDFIKEFSNYDATIKRYGLENAEIKKLN